MIDRAQALGALAASEFDLVVVGGGITGAGVALDASTRGFTVALVEGQDFAAGTSSRSSKLVHGGLRYLQSLDLALVREALLERRLLVSLAPHIVRPLPLVVAAFAGARPDRLIGVGLNLYDAMSLDRETLRSSNALRSLRSAAAARSLRAGRARHREDQPRGAESWSPERHRTISGGEVLDLLPALTGREPTSGYLFYDCQTDDARLVLTVLGEAERHGAVCANRLWATGLIESAGRVRGVRVRDQEQGDEIEVRGRNVINATGVWADRLGPLGSARREERPARIKARRGASRPQAPRIRPSRGTHVTVRHEDLPLLAGAVLPAGEGRSIFALPWLGRTLIGTTDSHYDGDLLHVRPDAAEIGYLLEAVNEFFATDLDESSLTGSFAGVRPLISAGDSRRSADISRRAELFESETGMITITGGKLTTWRRMAKQAVDRMVQREGRRAPCRTGQIPLGAPVASAQLERVPGVAEQAYEHLASRYGAAARAVLGAAAERPELAEPILAGMPDLLAEAVVAARHEQARSVADVLSRRTRLALLAAPELSGEEGGPVARVAEVMAAELGWGPERVQAEIEGFEREAALEGLCVA